METQTRPRSKSNFSFRSSKSDMSGSAKMGKMDLTESHAEKQKSRISGKSKINPNRAITEQQPAASAQFEASTLTPLTAIQHRDMYGNVIADPDKTNPTRSRMERPLDTIRAFEAAIDNNYKRRTQAPRADSVDAVPNMSSRRNSLYMGHNDIPVANPRRSPASGHGPQHNTFYRGHDGPYGPPPSQRRSMNQRMPGPPGGSRMSSDFGVYPVHAYHESHETIGESSGSHSTEQWGNSTDPSSENSSLDRVHTVKAMEASGDAYAGTPGAPYGRGSPMHEAIQEEHWSHQQGGYKHGPASPPLHNGMRRSPPQSYSPAPPQPQQRNIIRLGDGAGAAPATSSPQGPVYPTQQNGYTAPVSKQKGSGEDEKKGGWLKRRMSKKP